MGSDRAQSSTKQKKQALKHSLMGDELPSVYEET